MKRPSIPSMKAAGSTGKPKFVGLPKVQTQYRSEGSMQKGVKALNRRMRSTTRGR